MSGFRKKVLWVDDEIEMLRAHIMFLETRGYTVVPVFSGDDAVDIVREKPDEFDIVLLDEMMPGKDGLTTLMEIKEFRPDLPIVMVTKSEEEHLMEQALGKKIDGYLTKPVNPSQILLVCKRLLDSKQFIDLELRQQFLRNYSENSTALRGRMEPSQWVRLYESLARWDTELDKVEDEGIRQTHAGQKSDVNAAFSAFVEEHYGHWVKGERNPPCLSVNVLERFVDPLLAKGEQVYFVVMSGMRLDQYLCIEETLRRFFRVRRDCYYSILPTDTSFARPALLAGEFPLAIAEKNPDGWPTDKDDPDVWSTFEKKLVLNHMSSTKLNLADRFSYSRASETESLLAECGRSNNSAFIVIVDEFIDLLTSGRSSSPLAQAIAPDERALRSITRTWFENSALLKLFRELSQKKCTVVVTADHGSVYCTRETEVYGAKQFGSSLRYKFGKGMTADERHVLALNDPLHFNLPRMKKAWSCIIAKENYYFSHPENFTERHQEIHDSFQRGGISMEEIIMPLAVLTPL